MQLYFIRHGQSANNKIWEDTGASKGRHEDPLLTPAGEQQAQHVAEFLATRAVAVNGTIDLQNVGGFGITHVYCSLHERAVQTATPIAKRLALPLLAWPEIHEQDGIYLDDAQGRRMERPGKTRSFFEQHYPHVQLPGWLDERGWWHGRPAEDAAAMDARASACLDALIARHGDGDDRVAWVSHGAFFNFFMRAVLNLQHVAPGAIWISKNNCAVTSINFESPRQPTRFVHYINRLDFMPRALITV